MKLFRGLKFTVLRVKEISEKDSGLIRRDVIEADRQIDLYKFDEFCKREDEKLEHIILGIVQYYFESHNIDCFCETNAILMHEDSERYRKWRAKSLMQELYPKPAQEFYPEPAQN